MVSHRTKFHVGRTAVHGLIGLCLATALLVARPAAAQDNICGGGTGQAGRGFALQTGLGGRLLALSDKEASTFSSGFQWNLLLGYKLCRALVGLNFDLLVSSPIGQSAVATSFLIAPEVQVAIVQSADRRAEFTGMLRVGGGRQASNVHLGGALAPGMRYWLHPHIALTSQIGLAGDVILFNKGQAFFMSLFGTVGLLGSF